jgi:hypothetical protein
MVVCPGIVSQQFKRKANSDGVYFIPDAKEPV